MTSRKHYIAPSILSADWARLGEEVSKVVQAGADMIHIDVMDNHYVPNLTMGPLVCEALRRYGITTPLDVHLMVQPVDDLVLMFAEAGADRITFHPEAVQHVDRTIELIRHAGCKVGLALNPATPLSWLDYTLEKLDLVLLMTVNPGFGGQAFIPGMIEKIEQTREVIDRTKPQVLLSVDGGVTSNNIATLAKAGADVFVMGSAIFGTSDYQVTISHLRDQLKG